MFDNYSEAIPFEVRVKGINVVGEIDTQPGRKKPIWILVHGAWTDRNYCWFPAAKKRWSQYDFCRFDNVGHGESGPPRPAVDRLSHIADYNIHMESVHEIVLYLKEQGWQVEGVIGHSRGANIAMMYAGKYSGEVPKVMSLSGRFDLTQASSLALTDKQKRELKEDGETELSAFGFTGIITREHQQAREALDFKKICGNISSETTVYLAHAEDDTIIPISAVDDYEKACAHCAGVRSVKLASGGHNFIEKGVPRENRNDKLLTALDPFFNE